MTNKKVVVLSHERYVKLQNAISYSNFVENQGGSNLSKKEKTRLAIAKIGYNKLKRIIPFTQEEILFAVEKGDKHLNSLPMSKWNFACGYICEYGTVKSIFGHRYSPFDYIIIDAGIRIPSIAESVSILKEVALWSIDDEIK